MNVVIGEDILKTGECGENFFLQGEFSGEAESRLVGFGKLDGECLEWAEKRALGRIRLKLVLHLLWNVSERDARRRDACGETLAKEEDGLIHNRRHAVEPRDHVLVVQDVGVRGDIQHARDVLLDAVQGITQLIVHPGMINVDFADVRTVMSGMGAAIMGIGSASGEHRAREAAEKAIACPLLEDINLQGARGILVNITASDMGIAEFNEVGTIVHEFASEDAIIKIGTAIDPSLGDEIKVTVVATGMGTPAMSVKAPVKILPKTPAGENIYDGLDKPTVIRNKTENRETRFGAQPKKDVDLEYLDIPAFLRRQAD